MQDLEPAALMDGFRKHLARESPGSAEGLWLVAVSGGLDSLVLLHLLRFAADLPGLRLEAAHFDHRMRDESGRDALWVKGLCRAWSVPVRLGRTPASLDSEEAARRARYDFLMQARADSGAARILTAHHGDDQAETVLFRAFRGTGLAGLAGIPASRSPGIFRPLLPFSRQSLEAYARDVGIQPREDPSNRDLSIPRNALRHRILPEVEKSVAAGARRSLHRLARLARENESAWRSILPRLLEPMVREDPGGLSVVRSSFLSYHPAVRGRLLRTLLSRFGLILDEAGTRQVLEFTKGGASGRSLDLPGGVRIRREFDEFRLEPSVDPGEDVQVVLPGPEPGSGEARIGGRSVEVRWGAEVPVSGSLQLPLPGLEFPLRIRGWLPGDRILLSYGSKKLKKLLAEARVPAGARKRVPVLVDARGRVLWVVGVAVSALMVHEGRGPLFSLDVRYDDQR